MYPVFLLVHSWLRYVVLVLGLWLLVASVRGLRAGVAWGPGDDRLQVRFLGVLDTQLSIGLVLYFLLSPITAIAMTNLGAAMKDAQLRFFGVEHITAMVVAVAVAHIGRARGKRKEGRARYRTTLIAQALWLVLTAAAIPWPGLDIARPLFRG